MKNFLSKSLCGLFVLISLYSFSQRTFGVNSGIGYTSFLCNGKYRGDFWSWHNPVSFAEFTMQSKINNNWSMIYGLGINKIGRYYSTVNPWLNTENPQNAYYFSTENFLTLGVPVLAQYETNGKNKLYFQSGLALQYWMAYSYTRTPGSPNSCFVETQGYEFNNIDLSINYQLEAGMKWQVAKKLEMKTGLRTFLEGYPVKSSYTPFGIYLTTGLRFTK